MIVYILLCRGHIIAGYESYTDAEYERSTYYAEGRIIQVNVRPENPRHHYIEQCR